jgi:hypothetical protein
MNANRSRAKIKEMFLFGWIEAHWFRAEFSDYNTVKVLGEANRPRLVEGLCWNYAPSYNEDSVYTGKLLQKLCI